MEEIHVRLPLALAALWDASLLMVWQLELPLLFGQEFLEVLDVAEALLARA